MRGASLVAAIVMLCSCSPNTNTSDDVAAESEATSGAVSATPPNRTNHSLVIRDDLLAAMTQTGGLCADGPCDRVYLVTVDGNWSWGRPGTTPLESGTLSAQALEAAKRAVNNTQLAIAKGSTSTCEAAADGTDITYQWRHDGVIVSSDCHDSVPPGDPLVEWLDKHVTELD